MKKKKAKVGKHVDLKVHADSARIIDITCCRGYNVRNLLSDEINTTSYYSTTESYLRKATKSEFLSLLRTCQIPIREYLSGDQRTIKRHRFHEKSKKNRF